MGELEKLRKSKRNTFHMPTKRFCLKLGTNTSEYEVDTKGNFITIKKMEDIVRLKKELKIQEKLADPSKLKVTLGQYLSADPMTSHQEIRSSNHISSFADLDTIETPVQQCPSFMMPSTQNFLEIKNHLVFKTFGHLDMYTVVEKNNGDFYLE